MMKYFFTICIVALLFTCTIFSQQKSTTHKVKKGETITQIAQKYNVTPFDIYQLNPDAQNSLKPNSILLIPNSSVKQSIDSQSKKGINGGTHEVMPKETLYGIEKKYGITDEAIKRANPSIEKDGLKTGQILIIPSKNDIKTINDNKNTILYHEVLPKETKYSISKQYGITIEELEKRNPEIIPNLAIGYKLIIKGNVPKAPNAINQADVKNGIVKQTAVMPKKEIEFLNYEVKPKETLYSLSKMFNLSQEELISYNPALKNGVEIGMLLKIPSKTENLNGDKKEYTSLSKIIENGKRKKLVMLLPFNIPTVEGDTLNTTATRLKKDKFLNMTLDFYSGALVAIDSAKVLGLPIDIQIYDSRENRYGSNVIAIVQNNKLQDVNAIIGPFYQSNAEVVAQLLSDNNVPVISPLSKDVGNPYRNLYQTIPSNEALKNAMFDYMKIKNGNIIAVVDRKKESVIQYIKENQKEVQFVEFKDNGGLSTESLKSMLVKDKKNYVVMETANTGMIKSTIATLINSMGNYQVQLVILDSNETLDTDEIDFLNLVKLGMMYPSVTRENKSAEALIFEKKYRKINNIYPSVFATRGFDVTFDTMMRLVQDKKFEETVNSVATKQVDNQFEYYKKEDGGYTNKGVFILYYDTDLIIKEAN